MFCLTTECSLVSDFPPIAQELLQALVRERVLEELLQHLEWHRRDIRSQARGFDDVQWMANARRQHLRPPLVVAIDFDNLGEHPEPALSGIVEAAHEWADVGGARLRRQDRLRGGKAERDVDLDAFRA